MSASRLTLAYDPALGRANSWRLRDDLASVEARVRCGSAGEYSVTVTLRRGLSSGLGDERRFARCLDGTVWLVESSVLHEDLPRLELALAGAPDFVSDAMRAIS